MEEASTKGIPTYHPDQEPLMDVTKIMSILPHRPPFLLVDKILEMSDMEIVGMKAVTMNEPFFTGHFPGAPVMPGVLQLEAMAQVGGILALSTVPDRKLPHLLPQDGPGEIQAQSGFWRYADLPLELYRAHSTRHRPNAWYRLRRQESRLGRLLHRHDHQRQIGVISPLASIHPKAKLAGNVTVEAFAVIEADAEIGEGSWIASGAYVLAGSRLGKNCRVFHGAVVSGIPRI